MKWGTQKKHLSIKNQFYQLELQSYKTKEVNRMPETAGTGPRTFREPIFEFAIFNQISNISQR